MWLFFRDQLWRSGDTYVLAGDEEVVTKAGKHTHGLDRFFSSLYDKPVPGMSFFALSSVSVEERRAYPVSVQQIVRDPTEKAASKMKATTKKKRAGTSKGKPGRPKGSKNRNKGDVTFQTNGACAHVCLFSSDLNLTYDKLIDYCSLRLQIEFNFCDAKQF